MANRPSPGKIDLRDASAVRREMGAVYRDVRSCKLDSKEGARLIYILSAIRQAIETEMLEARVEQLEKQV